jgi:membrane dipeptidase
VLVDDAVVDAKTKAVIAASGLTVAKQTLGGSGKGLSQTLDDIKNLDEAISLNSSTFLKVRDVSDVDRAQQTGQVGVIYSFEAASMHEGKVDNIDMFAERGVRIMGLSYNTGSVFGSGTLSAGTRGLSLLGFQAIERMERLGIAVDLSHSDEETSFQAVEHIRKPCLITHAACSAVHPNPRNKSDRLLRALSGKGGVLGIFDLSYIGNYPSNPTLEIYMRHLTHAINVCGEEHVGIGSDVDLMGFDATPTNIQAWNAGEESRRKSGIFVPEEGPPPFVVGLNGPSRWHVIAHELSRRGYRTGTVERILGTNWRRVLAETWQR